MKRILSDEEMFAEGGVATDVDASDMDPQSAVATPGMERLVSPFIDQAKEAVSNVVTGKGLRDYYTSAVNAAKGDPNAQLDVAQRSLGTAIAGVQPAEGVAPETEILPSYHHDDGITRYSPYVNGQPISEAAFETESAAQRAIDRHLGGNAQPSLKANKGKKEITIERFSPNPEGYYDTDLESSIIDQIRDKNLSFFDPHSGDFEDIYAHTTPEGEVKGALMMGPREDTGMPNHTESIKVAPEFRGQEVASDLYDEAVKDKGVIRSSPNQTEAGEAFWRAKQKEKPYHIRQARDPETLQPLDVKYNVWDGKTKIPLRKKEMAIENRLDEIEESLNSQTRDMSNIPEYEHNKKWYNTASNAENSWSQKLFDESSKLNIPYSEALNGKTGNEEIDYLSENLKNSQSHKKQAYQNVVNYEKAVDSGPKALKWLEEQPKKPNIEEAKTNLEYWKQRLAEHQNGTAKPYAPPLEKVKNFIQQSQERLVQADNYEKDLASWQKKFDQLTKNPKNARKLLIAERNALLKKHAAINKKSGHTLYAAGGITHFDEGGVVSADTSAPLSDEQFAASLTQPENASAPPVLSDEEFAAQLSGSGAPALAGGETDYFAPDQQMAATAEGLGEGMLGPTLTHGIETGLGITTPEAIRGREENLGALKGITRGAGMIGSALTGVGEIAALGKASQIAAHAIPFLRAEALSAKVGAGAFRGALEMGLLSADDEVSRAILKDPAASINHATSNILMNMALGTAGGGLFGSVEHLLASPAIQKAAQEIENVKGQIHTRSQNSDPVEALHEELATRHGELRDMFDDTYGMSGVKQKAIAKAVPQEMNEHMIGQAQGIAEKGDALLTKMRKDPYRYPERFVRKFEEDIGQLKGALGAGGETDAFEAANAKLAGSVPQATPSANPQNLFTTIQDLKQMAQGYAKYGKMIKPIDEGYDFVHAMRPFGSELREALEDTKVWGDAAHLQKSINSEWIKFKPFLDEFESAFGEKLPHAETGEMIQNVSRRKLETFVNQAGTFKDEKKRAILKGFLDRGEGFAEALGDAYATIGEASPYTPNPMNVSRTSIRELTTGMKIANVLIDKGVKAKASLLGGGVGAAVGSVFGAPGVGAYIGEKTLGSMIEKILPLAGKAFFEKGANFKALQAVNSMVEGVAKGEAMISRSTRNLFKAGAEALPLPSEKALARLDKRLVAQSDQREKTFDAATSNPAAHYMPDAATQIAQNYFNALGYANQLRPKVAPQFPLDKKRTPSSIEQSEYKRALSIMLQPTQVIDRIKNGSVTLSDMQHLNALYPAAYSQFKTRVADTLTQHLTKGATIPYKTRIGLSLFMGQPMDGSFAPEVIRAAQPKQAPPPAQGPQQKSRGVSSTKLTHLSEDAMTPLQARQKREMKG